MSVKAYSEHTQKLGTYHMKSKQGIAWTLAVSKAKFHGLINDVEQYCHSYKSNRLIYHLIIKSII